MIWLMEKQRLFAYFGVYDGHGGHECTEFLKLSLDQEILSQDMLWETEGSISCIL